MKSYTMQQTDGEIISPGSSWIRGYQSGYDNIGNHRKKYHYGLCIQKEKEMSKILGRWTLIDSDKKWYLINNTKTIGQWKITNIKHTSKMTITFWINISKLYPSWTNILHVTNNNSNCCEKGDRVPGIWLYPNSSKMLVVADNEVYANKSIDSGDQSIKLDKSTLVSIVFNKYKISLYFDGQLVTEKKFAHHLKNANNNATFYCPDPWHGANGINDIETRIMNLTLYNKVLTQEEIQNIYYIEKLYLEQ